MDQVGLEHRWRWAGIVDGGWAGLPGPVDLQPLVPSPRDRVAPHHGLEGFGGGRDQTRAEAQQRADMLFQMLDANHDGFLDAKELSTVMSMMMQQQTAATPAV